MRPNPRISLEPESFKLGTDTSTTRTWDCLARMLVPATSIAVDSKAKLLRLGMTPPILNGKRKIKIGLFFVATRFWHLLEFLSSKEATGKEARRARRPHQR